jgi:hypothetical protein
MKRMVMVGALLMVLIFMGFAAVMGGQMSMGGQGGQQEQSSGQPSMMGRGMMGMPMMSMMCPMMDMMSGGEMDPKAMARMLEFRGDLLKAMGEVMLKHAKAMEAGK